MKYDLLTKYSENIDYYNILNDYPRPQLKRDSYLNLNGVWKYEINNDGNIPIIFDKEIIVPFPVESYLSKVNKSLKENEYLIYYKEFDVDKTFIKDKTIVHFEAVDQICEVYLNDILLGKNEGGYLSFSFDITNVIKENKNKLIVKVKDELNVNYPYGKQSKKRGGMWYTPVSGIWASVWVESVCKNYIKNIKLTPDIDNNLLKLEIDTDSEYVNIEVKDQDKSLYNQTIVDKYIEIPISDPKLWSPESPFLYKLYLTTNDDRVESYFAMRKFHTNNKYFCLNNTPYFINGVLDQGYFSDGIYTPSSYEIYRDDILTMKKLGFNTLRKHIKIEPKIFYYYCDLYGMLVFQDMVNVGKYDFIKHTALPTIGLKKMIGKNVNKEQKQNFINYSLKTIDYLYNFPSIVEYTIFNEGWGQFDADKLYGLLKEVDNTRVIDSTSGWFKNKLSDVDSLHIYFKKIKLKESDKPIFVSEFGGYSYKIKEHSFNVNKTYGYKKFNDKEDYQNNLIKLYKEEVLNNIKNNLAGAIYTQLSDVEDETNGLLTYDRRICKVSEKKIKEVMDEINKEFKKRRNNNENNRISIK